MLLLHNNKDSLIYIINGLGLLISFGIFRVGWLGYLAFYFVIPDILLQTKYISLNVVAFLWLILYLMNVYWFIEILIKVIIAFS